MSEPLVSIIVRTKNRPKLLKKALQSIVTQTYRPLEVILVNDGGCDLDIEEFRTILGDVSLNYQRLGKNMGRAHAGNVGINNATGEYVGFLDDDDELLPDHLSTLMGYFNHYDYQVAYTDALLVNLMFNTETLEISDSGGELLFSRDFDYNVLVFENYIPLMCLLFESRTLRTSNGFDPDFELYEDWDLLIRIGKDHPFYHLKKVTAHYNQWSTDSQISQRNRDQHLLRTAYQRILAKHIDKITPERIHGYMSGYVGTRRALIDAEARTEQLSTVLREKEASLKAELETMERHNAAQGTAILQLETAISQLETAICCLQEQIAEKDSLVDALRQQIEDSRIDTQNLMEKAQGEIRNCNNLLATMKDTLGWRMLERYRSIRNKFFHHKWGGGGSNSQVLKGFRVFRDQGFRAFMRKVNKKLLFNKSIRQTLGSLRLTAQPVHTAGAVASDTPIVSRVSVIIPTKNAGEEFDYILRKIAQQELVNDIELVIIDSGSDDRTLEICRAYTRNIVEIPPAEFHHARTRNLGVERATGEFLVFTVQDAVPIGNYWLYKLLYPIQEGQASAVSTLQIPRSDADLFATWSYWSHNLVFLGQDRDRLYNHSLFRNFDDLDMDLKRRMASLDNVCLGIRKSVFVDYKFTAEYAEDLELGMRLIKDGHSLIFQASNAVIHSHSRSALYFLKRSYIDTASILDLFSVSRGGLRTELALKASSYVYARLKMSISVLSADKGSVMYSAEGLRTLADTLCNNIDIFRPEWSLIPGNPMLDDYFESFEPTLHSDAVSSQCDYIGVLLKNFSVVSCNCVKDGDMEVDFLESIYKMFSLAAGTYIGTHTSTEIESLRGEI